MGCGVGGGGGRCALGIDQMVHMDAVHGNVDRRDESGIGRLLNRSGPPLHLGLNSVGKVSGSRRHGARAVGSLDRQQLLVVGLALQQRTQQSAGIRAVAHGHSAHVEVAFPAQILNTN